MSFCGVQLTRKFNLKNCCASFCSCPFSISIGQRSGKCLHVIIVNQWLSKIRITKETSVVKTKKMMPASDSHVFTAWRSHTTQGRRDIFTINNQSPRSGVRYPPRHGLFNSFSIYRTRTSKEKWLEVKLLTCKFVSLAARRWIVLANHFPASQSARAKRATRVRGIY